MRRRGGGVEMLEWWMGMLVVGRGGEGKVGRGERKGKGREGGGGKEGKTE